MINTIVGNRIKVIRKQLKMTGTEMAIRLGISQQHYSRLENGYIKITVDQLIVISLILGVSPQSLIVGTKGTEMVINVSDKASGQLSEIIVLREKSKIDNC